VARLLNLLPWKRRRLERDLERELRYHVDRRVEELLQTGLGAGEARRQASLELGGVPQSQEAVRDAWVWGWLDALARDLRYAIRSLRRSWGFSLGAGSVLALAIGANVAIFSVVHKVLLEPLAYPESERLVSIETWWTHTGRASRDVSGPDFLDWQARNDVFEKMAVSFGEDDVATVVGDRAVFVNDRYVSADFFAVFGLPASAGRLLTAEDVPTGEAEPTVGVVAHAWAVAHFGSAEAAVGKRITVYGIPLEIVGVASPGFAYPGAADIWAPWNTSAGGEDRSLHNYQAVGRLRENADLARAQAQMRSIGDQLAKQHPENRLKTVTLIPLRERLTGDLRPTLWALMGAVGVVWLIACANLANLLLARAAARRREIALRAALGAGRGRVVRQLLTESSVLAAVAGLAGLLLASALVRGVVSLSPANLPRLADVRMDLPVVLFALALSLVSMALFGLAPALQGSRLDLSDALKQGGTKATASRSSSRLRSALVVMEVGLSVMLLVAAGLLFRSFRLLQGVDLGFTTERVLVAYTQYVASNAEDRRARSAFYADVLDRLSAVPGVSAAAGVAFLPMGREPRPAREYFVQGRPEGRPGERLKAELYGITPGYFQTLKIPIRAGRDFDRADTRDRPMVAIVNETLARTVFGSESALGQHVRGNSKAPWVEIVGVVADTRWQDPSQPPPPMIFAPSAQGTGGSLSILARTSLDDESLAATLRAILRDANPSVPVRFETMEELFDFALAYPRFRTQVIGMFAAVAALLAAVGIFSVLAYLVGQRTRELAIRRALGARVADVIRLIVGQGLRLVAAGVVLGVAGALLVARLLAGLLYGVSPWDAGTYLGTIGLLGGVALLATLLPAIRAAAVAPDLVLRQD
jgi:predicted permease